MFSACVWTQVCMTEWKHHIVWLVGSLPCVCLRHAAMHRILPSSFSSFFSLLFLPHPDFIPAISFPISSFTCILFFFQSLISSSHFFHLPCQFSSMSIDFASQSFADFLACPSSPELSSSGQTMTTWITLPCCLNFGLWYTGLISKYFVLYHVISQSFSWWSHTLPSQLNHFLDIFYVQLIYDILISLSDLFHLHLILLPLYILALIIKRTFEYSPVSSPFLFEELTQVSMWIKFSIMQIFPRHPPVYIPFMFPYHLQVEAKFLRYDTKASFAQKMLTSPASSFVTHIWGGPRTSLIFVFASFI